MSVVPALDVELWTVGNRWRGRHLVTLEEYEADTADEVLRWLCRRRS